MKINSYKELIVWQRAMELAEEIYKITSQFPQSETYGLSSQMRRASVSIPSNVAEGYKRKHIAEYIHFLTISSGSGAELETQIELCKRIQTLNKLNFKKAEVLIDEVMKMLTTIIQKLSTKRYALSAKP